MKKRDPAGDTAAWEREIDRLIYELYGLTEGEIAIEGENRDSTYFFIDKPDLTGVELHHKARENRRCPYYCTIIVLLSFVEIVGK